MGCRGAIFFLAMFCLAWPVAAQTGPALLPARAIVERVDLVDGESSAERLAALQRWTRDYVKWETWFLRWRNRPEPGIWSSRPRRIPPVPPAWLSDACVSVLDDTSPLAEACGAWRAWSSGDDGASVAMQQMAQARHAQEVHEHTSWWEHVHIDGLWPMTQTGSQAIGLAGMHTTVSITERFAVFLAPGAILMRVPSITGGMTLSAATDWGFSYRLLDFRLPAMRRASTLHLNLVRVWLLGGNGMRSPGEMYLAGFSVTFKRR